MFKAFIGKRSNSVKNVVERGAVKKFAEAIGDCHPIFVDEEFGKETRYKQNIAPTTFPRVFDYGKIENFHLPNVGLIHGEQIFEYKRPLFVGETIYCYTEIKDYYEKKGGHGFMGFLVLSDNGEDQGGNLVFTAKSIVIITEEVRKVLAV
ncbi:MaoC family dehydratase N-terminal domain-containing protein [Gottfriedia luciferensis]|uniref:MaoC family dehydratase N-terminal domain-containing protein n=1 Tax=Gottfriedia luciferensis TaxID=178774 RepID=UPI000B42E33F|nr:MaoC family dehydratase N-terminal domain-containing protein [Gottfriedia luciferensis]